MKREGAEAEGVEAGAAGGVDEEGADEEGEGGTVGSTRHIPEVAVEGEVVEGHPVGAGVAAAVGAGVVVGAGGEVRMELNFWLCCLLFNLCCSSSTYCILNTT